MIKRLTNRRGALLAIGIAAFGGADWLVSRLYRSRQEGVAHSSLEAYGAELVNTGDDGARADLARLAAHVYSEEGIPMFLACENLSSSQTSRAPIPSTLSKKVASAFRRYAEEWPRVHPNATAADVSKIVEFLADRDFTAGGTETSL